MTNFSETHFFTNMIIPTLVFGMSLLLNLLPYAILKNFLFCAITGFSIVISTHFLSFFFLPYAGFVFGIELVLIVGVIGIILYKKKAVLIFTKPKYKVWIASFLTIIVLILSGSGRRIFEGYYEGHDILHYAKLANNMVHKNDLFIKYKNHNHDPEITADKHPPLFTTIIGADFAYAENPDFIIDFRFSKIAILLSWLLLILSFPFLLLKNQRRLNRILFTLAFLFSFPIFKLFVDFHIDAMRLLYITTTFYIIRELSEEEKETNLLLSLLVWFLVLGALIHSINLIWGAFCLAIYFLRNKDKVTVFKYSCIFSMFTFPWYFLEYFMKGKL